MNIQELCRIRKEELKLTYHDISDASGVPLSTVQNFFSKLSKAPSIYTVAPICKALGISLDEIFGISEHLTPTEETLQARNDELERHVDAKADTIEIMRRGVRIRNGVILILFIAVLLLAAWCVYIDLHCTDYGFGGADMGNCIKCKAALPDGALFCPMCGKKQAPEKRKALKRANGTGTVYKLQGRRTRPWVAAKNKVIIGYYPRKTDALEALERLNGKPLTERYNMTFAEVFEAWKAEHYREIGPSGVESYENAYKVFKPLYDKKFRDLRAADFQAVIDQHMSKSHSTVSKYKQLATQMSNWAMREEICVTNFAQYIKLPENVKKEKEIFTEDDIEKLEANGSDAAKIVLMLLATGMRIGELFSLPLADYHETYVVGGEKTKAGRDRVIPIRPEGKPYFAYFAAKATGTLLLSGYEGQHSPENYRKRDYYPMLSRLGIKRKTPHATRHTYATRAVKEGLPPEILQKVLGHADYSTTANIYTHIDPDTIVSAVTNTLLTKQESDKKKKP